MMNYSAVAWYIVFLNFEKFLFSAGGKFHKSRQLYFVQNHPNSSH